MSDKPLPKSMDINADIDQYIQAATRHNTRKTYRSAVEHFEVHWGGRLPTTPDQISRYLASYASSLSPSTLKTRLAALAQWHKAQGFVDPCASPQVKKVMKGIQAVHSVKPKQARPLQLEQLREIDSHLGNIINVSLKENDERALITALRNRALVLLGFWRGFRSDELTRLRIDDIEIISSVGLRGYLSQSKTDKYFQGTYFEVPALAELCPVAAYNGYVETTKLSHGAVFRKIDRWGRLHENALAPGSIPTLLRKIIHCAGVAESDTFSSHSLRRGFANWANQQGWSLHDLMHYVGWKDIQSAIRYVGKSHRFDNLINAPTRQSR